MQSFPLSITTLILLFIDLVNAQHSLEEQFKEQSKDIFSNLNFNANESTWGRLLIDRLPSENGIQYFRAHFGIEPPSQRVKFVLANPITYCKDEHEGALLDTSRDAFDIDTILVVKRGKCSFVEKTRRAQDEGAGGIVIINNEEGNIHQGSNPGENNNLNVSSVMISMHHGKRLINTLSKMKESLEGKYVPMKCFNYNNDSDNSKCEPLVTSDKSYVEQFNGYRMDGMIVVNGIDDDEKKHQFRYQQAKFGALIGNQEIFVIIDGSKYEEYFCSQLDHSHDIINIIESIPDEVAIMVRRGGCSFEKKAENVDLTGATMMIILNDDENEIIMGVESDYAASRIQCAAIMVSNDSAKGLLSLLERQEYKGENDNKMTITIHPSKY